MKYLSFLLFNLYIVSLSAQKITHDAVSSAADNHQQPQIGIIDWTIGELSIETWLNDTLRLTEGFHQPFLKVVSLYSPNKLAIKLYPNPSSDFIIIETEQPVSLSLWGVEGALSIENSNFETNFQIDISRLSAGTYFLTIKNIKGKTIDIRKIVKSNL